VQRCKSAYGLCKGAKVKETAIKGGTIGRPDDGLGFIHSVLDVVLYAVVDSALLELIIL
jgi:hypothetical protein